jgi:hypothetical protein
MFNPLPTFSANRFKIPKLDALIMSLQVSLDLAEGGLKMEFCILA